MSRRITMLLATLALLIPGLCLLELGLASTAAPNPVSPLAATITVTNLNDSGAGSLRQAIVGAAAGDTITFSPSLTGAITLTSGQLSINKSLTINGPGAGLLSVVRSSANGTSSFRIFSIGANQIVSISGLTISNGDTTSSSGGGGILTAGSLTVNECVISGNDGDTGGGGISIIGNGKLRISGSTISANRSSPGNGGAISNFSNVADSMIVENCTLSRNFADFRGGAIDTGGPGAIVKSSTISDNLAGCRGGGISVQIGNIEITNSTITRNRTTTKTQAACGGGGIANDSSTPNTIRLGSTIVDDNTLLGGRGPDILTITQHDTAASPITSLDYNLIGNTSNAQFTGLTSHDIRDQSANLAPLAGNGGPTQTHAPLNGSPAIDRGNNTNAPSTDQRGAPRIADGDGLAGAVADIGAVEVQRFVVTSTNNSGAGSLRDALLNNATFGGGLIRFNIPGTGPDCIANGPCKISPTSPLPSSSKAVDIDGYSQPGSIPNSSSGPNNNAVIRIHLSGAIMTAADGLVILATNSRVRGLALTGFGTALRLTNTSDCRITGNFIGLDPLGIQSGNNFGIMISDGGTNQIGSSTPVSDANIISGNSNGIEIEQGSNGNIISGNFIGVDRSGLGALPNLLSGVRVANSFQNHISKNHIAFNAESGVSLASGTGNSISWNQIHDNGLLGIDLGEDGVTSNDAGDTDTGANNLQNFPEITYAAYDGINTTVRGTLNHTLAPTTNVSLEFFASSTCDSSGHGEGEAVIGSEFLLTDANGNLSFDLSFPSASTGEKFITATATSSNTSEFSLCRPVVTLDSIFQFSAPTFSVNEGATTADITVTRTGGAAGEVAVVFQAISGSAQGGSSCGAPGVDFVNTSGSFIWPHGDSSPKTFTIPICNDHDIESAVETIELVLMHPSSGTTIGPQGTAVLLIQDNDTPGQVRFGAPIYMTDESNSSVTFTVTRFGVDGPAASVDYSTISGSATGGASCGELADYMNVSGTLTWAAGEMGSKTGTVNICNDAIQEPNEAFTLALTNPNGVTIGTQTSAGVVINDNDDPGQVQFSVSNYSVGESNTTVSFTVTRTAVDGPAVSIDYATAGGTAAAGAACGNGSDFINTLGTLSWPAGDVSSRSVNLTICNDTVDEVDETVHLTLTNPTGGVVPPPNPALLVTISDDDLFRQVTNTNDDGVGSLRQALADVSSVSPTGTGSINFSPGLAGTITLLTALPDITRDVRIEGPGAKLLSVKRSDAPSTPQFRIFTISAGSDVYLSGLTLANGRPNGNGSGGAISNEGTLHVESCSVEANSAFWGGGVTNAGNMTLTNSTIVGNTSLFTGAGFGGGGIQNFGQLLIVGCTISGNSAAPGRGSGGGISNGPHAQLTIEYSTITANTAFGGTLDNPNAGGGIFQFAFPDHNPVIKGSIIAGNIAPTGPDLTGPFTSGDYNLFGITQGADITGEIAHNLTNVDASLAALADNGGPTRTHALLTDSPAIDRGDNREPPATDQRGLPRVSDGDNDGSELPDIGAFEVQSSCSITFLTLSLAAAVEGANYHQPLEVSGGTPPYTFSLTGGALPTGLALSNEGMIFGTVGEAGSFDFEVTVSDVNNCSRRKTYTLLITAPACAVDVSSQLSIVRGGLRQNLVTRRFSQNVTLKNMGTTTVAGPLSLMLDSLPGSVTLYNRAGVTICFPPLGNPYVNVSVGDDAMLTPGETVTLVLEFTNSNTQQSITYVPHVLTGPVR